MVFDCPFKMKPTANSIYDLKDATAEKVSLLAQKSPSSTDEGLFACAVFWF